MSTDQVSRIISQIRSLPTDERARLLDELLQEAPPIGNPSAHSLLELVGLGKELWDGVNAQEYVRNERGTE
jgi:hypothetical protein